MTDLANETGPSTTTHEDFDTQLEDFLGKEDKAKTWFYLSNFIFFSVIKFCFLFLFFILQLFCFLFICLFV